MFISTPYVLGVNLLETLLLTPCGDLEIADDHRVGTFSNRNHVAHVVAMPVADEDVVRLHLVRRDGSNRIPAEQRIDYDFGSACFETQRCMSVPGQFRGH